MMAKKIRDLDQIRDLEGGAYSYERQAVLSINMSYIFVTKDRALR